MNLNERAALAAGWTSRRLFKGGFLEWFDPDGKLDTLPDCEHSMDAAYALLWPLVQARGYSECSLIPARDMVILWKPEGWQAQRVTGRGSTIAAAFTLACLEVLEEKP